MSLRQLFSAGEPDLPRLYAYPDGRPAPAPAPKDTRTSGVEPWVAWGGAGVRGFF